MGLFKTYSQREVKKVMPLVKKINSLEPEMEKLSAGELAAKTDEFKKRLSEGTKLDDLLPEAFAVVREASKRVIGLRHFDVQLIGGIILHQGRIAEMKTGEGKTLVETLPAYLNALEGKGVHIVTVNEYLAKRDSEWMGKIFKYLGLTVGLNLNQMSSKEKRKQYACDIMYTTNNELGFDYLRDNMVLYKEDMVQRPLHYGIVDEIDSILIDEARTPLIISGRATKSNDIYKDADRFVRTLTKKEIVEEKAKDKEQAAELEKYDYVVDLKSRTSTLTAKGAKKAEEYFNLKNLNDLENSTLVHHINQSLQAHGIMRKDIDYIVKNGEALIVDEFTGRIMYGRRYSNGLHQAIEAKEGITIAEESQTLATITFQNFFRIYDKLAGMTGTAMTEGKEFREIYNLDVVEIPTNLPVIRKDETDVIFKNQDAKYRAVIKDIEESHKKGQPVLVGTISIQDSEKLSNLLKKKGLKHTVLNAKNHEAEAEIVAQAGKLGAITIATNMAGRGTDIMLGGNSDFLAKEEMQRNGRTDAEINEATAYSDTDDEYIIELRKEYKDLVKKFEEEIADEKEQVKKAGGLRIIGTERHDSRRIDNQLRGRSGRQGDPGESKFYVGLDDHLMHIFGGDIVSRYYDAVGIDENVPLQTKLLSRQLENAQKKVEGINFDSRKRTLQYDDVMNVQRQIIYKQRRQVLDGEDMGDAIKNMVDFTVDALVDTYQNDMYSRDLNVEIFKQEMSNMLNITEAKELEKDQSKEKIDDVKLREEMKENVHTLLKEKEAEIGKEFEELERVVILKVVDDKWMEHIDDMEDLRHGIGLRGYAQQDPVVQYRLEGSNMFDDMITDIKIDVAKLITHAFKSENTERTTNITITDAKQEDLTENIKVDNKPPKASIEKKEPIVNEEKKVGRNDPCPCGSGKKYKNCHGKQK